MFPEEFVQRLKSQSQVNFQQLLEALERPSPISIRVNTGKWKHAFLLSDSVSWEKSGFYLEKRPQYTLDPFIHAGVYYPQEASSMFVGEAFRQVTSDMGRIRVLDLCGAPGGKSTHLSSLLKEDGLLVANEVIRNRAAILAENITKWGHGNAMVSQSDPSAFSSLPGFFDVILVDAPCSGEGMFRDEAAVGEWSPANAQLCSERQRRILMDVWPALRSGGMLIYSTCTFNPAENEQNVNWLTETAGAESVALDISGFEDITTVPLGDTISYAFYPGKARGDGFFLSVLSKTEPTGKRSNVKKSHSKSVWSSAPSSVKSFLTQTNENVFMNGTRVIALASSQAEHETIAASLNIIKSGTMLGEVVHGKFIPSHDLAMSANIFRDVWNCYDATYDEAISFLRMDDFIPVGVEQGRVLICYRDVPLGFVNHLGKRANNCYPSGWRVRMEKKGIFEDIL